jgi:uncharacterized membrane protein YhaH (DUF805 family)
MDFLWYLFSFEGRINRAKFWLAALIIFCWMIFLAILTVAATVSLGGAAPMTINFDIDDIFGILDPASFRALSSTNPAALVLHLIGTPLFVWVYLATAAKRLHDRGRSGWWMVLFFVVPGLYGQPAWRFDFCQPARPCRRLPDDMRRHHALFPERRHRAQPIRIRPAGADRDRLALGSGQRTAIRAA